MISGETAKQFGRGAGAGSIGGVGVAGILAFVINMNTNSNMDDMKQVVRDQAASVKELSADMANLRERLARFEGWRGKVTDHLIWKDGDNQYTAELKSDGAN